MPYLNGFYITNEDLAEHHERRHEQADEDKSYTVRREPPKPTFYYRWLEHDGQILVVEVDSKGKPKPTWNNEGFVCHWTPSEVAYEILRKCRSNSYSDYQFYK